MYLNSFYVETGDFDALVECLRGWTDTRATSHRGPSLWQFRSTIFNDYTRHEVLYVYQDEGNWCGIDHLALIPLNDWGARLSQLFAGRFIQIHYERLNDAPSREWRPMPPPSPFPGEFAQCYFLLFESGIKLREISVRSHIACPDVDFGHKFNFEQPFIHAPKDLEKALADLGDDEDDTFAYELYGTFCFDTLVEYCKAFGFDLMDFGGGRGLVTLIKEQSMASWLKELGKDLPPNGFK